MRYIFIRLIHEYMQYILIRLIHEYMQYIFIRLIHEYMQYIFIRLIHEYMQYIFIRLIREYMQYIFIRLIHEYMQYIFIRLIHEYMRYIFLIFFFFRYIIQKDELESELDIICFFIKVIHFQESIITYTFDLDIQVISNSFYGEFRLSAVSVFAYLSILSRKIGFLFLFICHIKKKSFKKASKFLKNSVWNLNSLWCKWLVSVWFLCLMALIGYLMPKPFS